LIPLAMSIAGDKTVIRVGHFPNITHVQGLVAHSLSRQGKGLVRSAIRARCRDSVVYLQCGT
jgi:hypothetical protein